MSTPAVGPTQPSVHLAVGALSLGVKRPGLESVYFCLVPNLKGAEVYLRFWRVQDGDNFALLLFNVCNNTVHRIMIGDLFKLREKCKSVLIWQSVSFLGIMKFIALSGYTMKQR